MATSSFERVAVVDTIQGQKAMHELLSQRTGKAKAMASSLGEIRKATKEDIDKFMKAGNT
jgi:hypothetical protein